MLGGDIGRDAAVWAFKIFNLPPPVSAPDAGNSFPMPRVLEKGRLIVGCCQGAFRTGTTVIVDLRTGIFRFCAEALV